MRSREASGGYDTQDGGRPAAGPKRMRRRLIASVAVAAVAVTAVVVIATHALAPSGRLLFVGDFETRNFAQWSGVQSVSRDRYAIVTSPRRQGAYAARFESRAGECIPMDCGGRVPRGRTEALIAGRRHAITEGEDVWYRWYTLFPSGGPVPDLTFTQWRANDEQSGPRAINGLFGLMTVEPSAARPDGFLAFKRNGIRWTAALRRGEWIKFLVHIKYSADPRIGTYELWLDDQHVMSFHDQSKPANTGVYFKQGVYRNDGTPSATVYDDGLRIATTRAVADPGWIDRLLGQTAARGD